MYSPLQPIIYIIIYIIIAPCYIAAWHFHSKILRILIKSGADINKCNYYGKSPLYIASYVGAEKCVSMLISSGSDINKKDKDGRTPLSVSKTEKIKIKLKNASDLEIRRNYNTCCSLS